MSQNATPSLANWAMLLIAVTTGCTTAPTESGETAPAGDSDQYVPPPPPPSKADRTRLAGFLEDLSSDTMAGRLTGTPSGDAAASYLLDRLNASGIETATQEVRFPLFEVAGPALLEEVDAAGAAIASFAYVDDFREVDFSGSAAVTGDLAFVGYGLVRPGYDSYAGFDVTGKIAAILTGVPPGLGLDEAVDGRIDVKIHEAFNHGAVGVLFIPAGSYLASAAQRPWELKLAALDEYGDFHAQYQHPELPSAVLQLGATSTLLGQSASSLASYPTPFDAGRRVRLEIHGTSTPQATCQNIFGIMRGTSWTLGDEVVVIGAHYDHLGVGADGRIFNGAGDNASGTAVLLETAVSWMESGSEPKRTLLFAFWCGEEQGLWGSITYVFYGTPLFPTNDTVMMVQVDYLGEADGPFIVNLDRAPLVSEFLGDSRQSPQLPVRTANWGGQCASDDCPFLWANVPAYRLFADGVHHHQATDVFSNINMDMVERVADVVLQGTVNVSGL